VLKPGGRLAVSDIALKQQLPAEIAEDVLAYVGCVAGAVLIEDYRQRLLDAGFSHVEIIDSGSDLNAYTKIENQSCASTGETAGGALPVVSSGCCSPGPSADEGRSMLSELLAKYDVNKYAASVRVYAVKQ
jgi:hypothetical protein